MSLLYKISRVNINTCLRQAIVAQRYFSNETTGIPENEGDNEKKGFAKAYESHTKALKPKEQPADNETFASLLRNSKFIDVSLGESSKEPSQICLLFFCLLEDG